MADLKGINLAMQTPFDENGAINYSIFEDLIEKPSRAEAPSRLAVAARYVFKPGIFALLSETSPGKGGEIQLTDAIQRLIRQGGRVRGVRLKTGERRYDIGNFPSYFRAFCDFALADPRHGPELREYLRKATAL